MLRSMTAYARAKKSFDNFTLNVEMHSVNRRHLDLQIRLPVECLALEPHLRKSLCQVLHRGQVTITFQIEYQEGDPVDVVVNLPLAKKIKNAIESLSTSLGLANNSSTAVLDALLRDRNVLQIQRKAEATDAFTDAFDTILQEALREFILMKQREGMQLAQEFLARLKVLEQAMSKIESGVVDAPKKYRQRLQSLLTELFPESQSNDERIVKEIAIIAEKLDVTEEISRFRMHLEHFRRLLEGEAFCEGKTLEFILQELGREINTIGSKAQDGTIAEHVINVKAELEKIREQVQNVE